MWNPWRFAFRELMPDTGLLSGVVIDRVPLDGSLVTLNERIVGVLDRNRQIGHAYFLNADGGPRGYIYDAGTHPFHRTGNAIPGRCHFPGILLDMNQLFPRFFGRVLDDIAPQGYRIDKQSQRAGAVLPFCSTCC